MLATIHSHTHTLNHAEDLPASHLHIIRRYNTTHEYTPTMPFGLVDRDHKRHPQTRVHIHRDNLNKGTATHGIANPIGIAPQGQREGVPKGCQPPS